MNVVPFLRPPTMCSQDEILEAAVNMLEHLTREVNELYEQRDALNATLEARLATRAMCLDFVEEIINELNLHA